jgi:hypothetical protein
MMVERREVPDRRHPPRLAPPRCPICREVPKKIAEAGIVVPITGSVYVRHEVLKSSDEVHVCFPCEPCGRIWCAVKTRKVA